MKAIVLLTSLLVAFSANAQIDDRTETDCDGNSRSIYATGLEGRPLIVASKGLDCSICMNHAPAVAAFAESNTGIIDVWGAMAYRYSTATPTCGDVEDWVSSYNWSHVFSFVDEERHWVALGFPTYYVIHPNTHEVAYQGSNWSIASNTALDMLQSLSTEVESSDLVNSTVHADGHNLRLLLSKASLAQLDIAIYNIAGQKVSQHRVNSGSAAIRFPFTEKPGIYILHMERDGQSVALKFAMLH